MQVQILMRVDADDCNVRARYRTNGVHKQDLQQYGPGKFTDGGPDLRRKQHITGQSELNNLQVTMSMPVFSRVTASQRLSK